MSRSHFSNTISHLVHHACLPLQPSHITRKIVRVCQLHDCALKQLHCCMLAKSAVSANILLPSPLGAVLALTETYAQHTYLSSQGTNMKAIADDEHFKECVDERQTTAAASDNPLTRVSCTQMPVRTSITTKRNVGCADQ